MTGEISVKKSGERTGIFLLVLHGACFFLVVVYVNMFQFWAWLSREIGPGVLANMLPIIVTLVVLLFVSMCFARRVNSGYRIKFVFLGLGVVGTFLSLAIPDPNIPIKRIHVAEYIILSFFVRYTLSHRQKGTSLFFFTVLATALYGIHDEMLQGLHTLRYYGWRDIIVNSAAGLSGALLGHGLVCFESNDPDASANRSAPFTTAKMVLFTVLFSAMTWQVIYLYRNRAESVPIYVVLPVLMSCIVITVLYPKTVFNSREHHGLQAVFWLTLTLCAYPVLAAMGWREFL